MTRRCSWRGCFTKVKAHPKHDDAERRLSSLAADFALDQQLLTVSQPQFTVVCNKHRLEINALRSAVPPDIQPAASAVDPPAILPPLASSEPLPPSALVDQQLPSSSLSQPILDNHNAARQMMALALAAQLAQQSQAVPAITLSLAQSFAGAASSPVRAVSLPLTGHTSARPLDYTTRGVRQSVCVRARLVSGEEWVEM